jgi:hypothetical protein
MKGVGVRGTLDPESGTPLYVCTTRVEVLGCAWRTILDVFPLHHQQASQAPNRLGTLAYFKHRPFAA